jgi:hypothetical protein
VETGDYININRPTSSLTPCRGPALQDVAPGAYCRPRFYMLADFAVAISAVDLAVEAVV